MSQVARKHVHCRASVDTVKPVLNRHSKVDKTKILMTNGSLMQVESVAELSFPSAPHGLFIILQPRIICEPVV